MKFREAVEAARDELDTDRCDACFKAWAWLDAALNKATGAFTNSHLEDPEPTGIGFGYVGGEASSDSASGERRDWPVVCNKCGYVGPARWEGKHYGFHDIPTGSLAGTGCPYLGLVLPEKADDDASDAAVDFNPPVRLAIDRLRNEVRLQGDKCGQFGLDILAVCDAAEPADKSSDDVGTDVWVVTHVDYDERNGYYGVFATPEAAAAEYKWAGPWKPGDDQWVGSDEGCWTITRESVKPADTTTEERNGG